jgi:uncharacterized protein
MLPWYKDGLRFKCTGCGECCTGSPGYVWLTLSEAEAMAEFLKIPVEEFMKKYTRQIGSRISLKEHPKTYDCVFLSGKKCQVYSVRPKQCRTFPFWPENLKSAEHWKETAARCEGIDQPDAPLVSLDDIQKQL